MDKFCYGCNTPKDESEFHKETKRADGLASQCKACRSDHYKKTYPARAERIRATNEARRRTLLEQVTQYKMGKPCMDCGNTFPPIAMDFDHRGGVDKEESISRLVQNGASLEVIGIEMSKCDLVCACCHRIRTQRRNMHKYGAVPEWLTGLPAKQFFASSNLASASEELEWYSWFRVEIDRKLRKVYAHKL